MYASTEYHGRTVTPHSMRNFISHDRRETRLRTGAMRNAMPKNETLRSALNASEASRDAQNHQLHAPLAAIPEWVIARTRTSRPALQPSAARAAK